MKRTAVLVLAIAFLLSACISPLSFFQQAGSTPAVDEQATNAVLAQTQAAETLNALPTPTQKPATVTFSPVPTETAMPAATMTATESLTPNPNATSVEAGMLAAGTTSSPTTATTGTFAPALQDIATATETLHPRYFGTLPPAIPFGKVILINKAKAEVYVSLQCATIDGYTTIIEYPVFGRRKVSAPAGRYIYVAWVGGRQLEGFFSLSRGGELSITFYKDKVTIK